jgi:hypothetical protein
LGNILEFQGLEPGIFGGNYLVWYREQERKKEELAGTRERMYSSMST